eukprot:758404-Hanusia_phi.AAC.6
MVRGLRVNFEIFTDMAVEDNSTRSLQQDPQVGEEGGGDAFHHPSDVGQNERSWGRRRKEKVSHEQNCHTGMHKEARGIRKFQQADLIVNSVQENSRGDVGQVRIQLEATTESAARRQALSRGIRRVQLRIEVGQREEEQTRRIGEVGSGYRE